MSTEAMKLALEALEYEAEGWENVPPITREAIAVLRERLAQPKRDDGVCRHCSGAGCVACDARHLPKPVAWMHNFIEGNVITHRPADIDRHPERWTALYTTQPRRENT